jgi:hypothetical protein
VSEQKQGKGRKNVNVHSRIAVADYMEQRGARMDWSLSKYAMGVINWWLAQGAPPVHQAEVLQPEIPLTPDVLEGLDVTKIPLQGSTQPFPTRDQDKPLKPASSGAAVARNYLSVGK